MIGDVTVQDAMHAAAGAVALVDRMAGQMARVFRPWRIEDQRIFCSPSIRAENGAIVSAPQGEAVQRVTLENVLRLPEQSIRHMLVLERAMENHYEAWLQVFPKCETADPSVREFSQRLLRRIVSDMSGDVEEVLVFLEHSGIRLDGHYEQVRQLIRSVGRDDMPEGEAGNGHSVANP
jgi:hypothetical protein